MKKTIYIFIISLTFINCKKDTPVETIDFHYNYIPTEVGTWTEYNVREITHSTTGAHDTTNYFLKEIVTSEIETDHYRIERFWKTMINEPWTIKDVWTRRITATNFQQIEENINFTKIVFPVNENKNWDGNAFNNNGKLIYEYSIVHESYNLNSLSFDSTITVIQQDNKNAIEYQTANEVYAKNVGLIYKEKIDLDINFFDKEDINEGTELKMELIDYGN